MTTYAVGSDVINGSEQSYINQAIQRIQESGNEGESLGVGPGVVQKHGIASESEGQIGVMIVGGRGLGTPMDFHTGIENGYYHYSHVYVIGSKEFTGKELIGSSSMDTPVNACEPQMSASQCSLYKGLTPNQFNQKYTNCTVIYCDNFADGLNTMLGGATSSDDSEDTGTSYKDMIKDLIKVWDGEVEARIDQDVFNIRHIPPAEQDEPLSTSKIHIENGSMTYAERQMYTDHNIPRTPELWISEGVNIVSGSLSMTDYNPDTINTLDVTYTDVDGVDHTIRFQDKILVDRFGEKAITKAAVKYAHVTVEETNTDTDEDTTTEYDDTVVDEDTINITDTETDTSDEDTTTDDTADTDTSAADSETSTTDKVIEIPIQTYDEAVLFGLGEWYKLQRDNGHKVECKVIGTNLWREGRWCKVYLPIYSEYCDMYVDRVSHELDSEGWITSLELLPAPACIQEDDSEDTEETQAVDSTMDTSGVKVEEVNAEDNGDTNG
jgi:hypothetical protein